MEYLDIWYHVDFSFPWLDSWNIHRIEVAVLHMVRWFFPYSWCDILRGCYLAYNPPNPIDMYHKLSVEPMISLDPLSSWPNIIHKVVQTLQILWFNVFHESINIKKMYRQLREEDIVHLNNTKLINGRIGLYIHHIWGSAIEQSRKHWNIHDRTGTFYSRKYWNI